ncbi:MAG: exodeoxyribonuclease III [Desulfomonilaceae bacterium]
MSRLIKLLSWNVNGIRAVQKKGFLEWLETELPDILCIQETKATPEQLDEELLAPAGYKTYWSSAQKKGYSGVSVYSKIEPKLIEIGMGRPEFDNEGRIIRLDYGHFELFNVYFPNGKSGKERLDYKMSFYGCFLEWIESIRKKNSNIIFVGDVNTAHNEIDLARPKENSKVSGFLPIERQWIDKAIEKGYVDTFRRLNGDLVQYSWWDLKSGARKRNIGWRIDYIFMSSEMAGSVEKAFIMTDVMGSDHCPVGVEFRVA